MKAIHSFFFTEVQTLRALLFLAAAHPSDRFDEPHRSIQAVTFVRTLGCSRLHTLDAPRNPYVEVRER